MSRPATGAAGDHQPRAEADRRGREVEDFLVAFTGRAPSFDDYRRVYAQLGAPYPGDEEIARSCPVAS